MRMQLLGNALSVPYHGSSCLPAGWSGTTYDDSADTFSTLPRVVVSAGQVCAPCVGLQDGLDCAPWPSSCIVAVRRQRVNRPAPANGILLLQPVPFAQPIGRSSPDVTRSTTSMLSLPAAQFLAGSRAICARSVLGPISCGFFALSPRPIAAEPAKLAVRALLNLWHRLGKRFSGTNLSHRRYEPAGLRL